MVGVYIHAILAHLQMYLQRPPMAHNILTTVMTNIVVDNWTTSLIVGQFLLRATLLPCHATLNRDKLLVGYGRRKLWRNKTMSNRMDAD